ncbi:MAG: RND transporter [Flavobacteriales bacterium]|nr:RND transporter [Flavobacteriales bacterium]
MKRLIAYFIKYPIAGNILMILLILMGWVGMKSLRTTFFPETESKFIRVSALYPGASPSEIEEGIVLKIEDRLEGLNGVERVTSVSQENFGSATVEVNSNYDTDVIIQDVKNAVDGINTFPSGMEPVSVSKFQRPQHAISIAISGELSLKELKGIAREWESILKEDSLISQVELEGFPDEEIEIQVRDELLKKYGLTIEAVANSVKKDNLQVTGGEIKTAEENILIRARNKKYIGGEFEQIVVKTMPNGNLIRLKDVALIRDGWVDEPAERFVNGKKAIVVKVLYTIHEDLKSIVEKVKKHQLAFNEKYPSLETRIIRDRSKILVERIDLLINNGLLGFLMVFILLSMFLHPRLAIWVAMAIPIAFGGMFILAGGAGISINVISLFGMIIVIGILVDDGIVIAENIYQHWERGKDPAQAAIDGTLEVLPAVFSAILTTVIAFSLFFVIDGIMGDFFVEMGFVVVATLVISLVEGALILPAHVAHSKALSKQGQKGFWLKVISWFTKALNFMKNRFYKPLFEFSFKQIPFILIITVGALLIGIFMISYGYVKVSMFPPIFADSFTINLEMASGTNREITEGYIDQVQDVVWEYNDSLTNEGESVVEAVTKGLGEGSNKASLIIMLTPSEERTINSSQITTAILKKVGSIPNAEKLTAKAGMPFGRPISVAIYSSDNSVLDEFKEKVLMRMREMGTLKNIESSDQKGMLELNIQLKDKAFSLGLTYAEIINEIRSGFYGYEVQRLQRGLDEVKVWVRFSKESRRSIGDFENKTIKLRGNEYLIKDLVHISQGRGVVKYEHLDGKRMVKIEADLMDPENSSQTELLAYVNNEIVGSLLKEYPQVKKSIEGQAREFAKVGVSVQKRGWIILLFMFVTVVLTFRSFTQAIAVFITSIFGFSGVVFGHFIHDYQLSMFSFFGMIALIGIMVNDALVLISALNINLKSGMKYKEALKKAAVSRFRPIVLTSVTTIAGLAPLIFEKSMQAQFLIPMAIAIAYGLLTATFLTLIFLPITLYSLNSIKVVIHWLQTGKVLKNKSEQLEASVKELKYERLIDEEKN